MYIPMKGEQATPVGFSLGRGENEKTQNIYTLHFFRVYKLIDMTGGSVSRGYGKYLGSSNGAVSHLTEVKALIVR